MLNHGFENLSIMYKSLTKRCPAFLGVRLRAVMPSLESDHCEVRLRDVQCSLHEINNCCSLVQLIIQ